MTALKNINSIIIDIIKRKIDDEELCDKVISKFNSEEVQSKIAGIVAGKNSKNSKNAKKSSGPKKPLSAYIFYCKENRTKVKEENPDSDAKEITCLLAEGWNKIKNDSKKCGKYIKLANDDKERYNREKENFVSNTANDSDKKVKEKKSSDKLTIKKARTSYILYCSDMRKVVKDENPELGAKEIVRKLGEQWREEKENNTSVYKKYVKMAELDKERYEKEKAEENNNKESSDEEDREKNSGVENSDEDENDFDDSKTYKVYCKVMKDDVIKDNPNLKNSEIVKILAKNWKKLSRTYKKAWRNKVNKKLSK